MSFCRITGRSRNLPKPHYFPLIPPISPADARRICRVTGKAFGLPMHHYIPVLLRKTGGLSKCRITKVADMYGKRKHYPLAGFRYVRPVLNNKNEQQKRLMDLLKTKKKSKGQFVYTVKERKCGLIFPAQLEHAVRDGDIKDVMLAKNSDTVLLKFKKGEDISVVIADVNEEEYSNDEELFEGEGMTEDETPKVKKKQKSTMGLAKIFEDKEKIAVDDEVVVHKKKSKKENKTTVIVNGEDWRNLIQPLIECWDWATFEQEAAKGIPMLKWAPPISQNGSEAIEINGGKKIPASPLQFIQEALSKLTDLQLQQTANIFQKLINGGKHTMDALPFVHEIQGLIRKLSSGTLSELAAIPGLSIFTEKSRFVIGLMMETKRGNLFVPGQTANGVQFLPGFIVNTDNGPVLIPGFILAKQKHSAVFLPGQNMLMENGIYDFKPGQLLIPCQDLDVKNEKTTEKIDDGDVETWEVKIVNGTEYLEKHQGENLLSISENCDESLTNKTTDKMDVIENENSILNEIFSSFSSLDDLIMKNGEESNTDINVAMKIVAANNFKNKNLDKMSKITVAISNLAQQIFQHTGSISFDKVKITNETLLDGHSDILKQALLAATKVMKNNSNQVEIFNAINEVFVNYKENGKALTEICQIFNSKEKCLQVLEQIIKPKNPCVTLKEFALNIEKESGLQLDMVKKIGEQHHLNGKNLENLTKMTLVINHFAQNFSKSSIDFNKFDINTENAHEDILNKALLTVMKITQNNPNASQELIISTISDFLTNLKDSEIILAELCQILNSSDKCEEMFETIIENNRPVHTVKSLKDFTLQLEKESGLELDTAKKVAAEYHFNDESLENVSKLIVAITHFAQNIFKESTLSDFTTSKIDSEFLQTNHCNILKNALLTVTDIIHENPNVNQKIIFSAISEIFASLNNSDIILTEICEKLNTSEKCRSVFKEIIERNNHKFPNVSKVDILKSALNNKNDDNIIIEKLSTIIEEDLLAPAFKNVSVDNPQFLQKVLNRIYASMPQILNDQTAYEMLQTAIVAAIKETSEQQLTEFLMSEEDQAIKDLLQEAIGLAVALGMSETADSLQNLISDPRSTHLIADDPLTLEILKRLTVMRQLAEKQPVLNSALVELKRNPHNARSDPKLRELVRESAVLMVPDVQLQTSENIPIRLFQEHNTLAMEDFLTRNRQPGTLLIIKRGLQAVVPKEASRAVLNGKVAYTLIDETGIRHFKPLHVISALRLSKPTAIRFSMYECLGARERTDSADKVKDFTNRLLACF